MAITEHSRCPTAAHVGLPKRALELWGGGVQKRYFNAHDLVMYDNEKMERPALVHAQYDLVRYVPVNSVLHELTTCKDSIALRVSVPVVVDKLNVPELKALCALHGIATTGIYLRPLITNLILGHNCSQQCQECYAIFVPIVRGTKTTARGIVDVEDPKFLESCKVLPVDIVGALVPDYPELDETHGFHIKRVFRTTAIVDLAAGDIRLDHLPLNSWAKHLLAPGLRSIGAFHHLQIPANWNKPEIQKLVSNHICQQCPALSIVVTPWKRVISESTKSSQTPFTWKEFTIEDKVPFPPRPLCVKRLAQAMKGYCDGLSSSAVEEDGCAVCGQLEKVVNMRHLTEFADDLSTLLEPTATRSERIDASQPYGSIEGPVILEDKKRVCSMCAAALQNKRRPKLALANFLWLGDVPDVLQGLTFAEQTLISRVRHNRCVVRVSSGHVKMTANVIAFEHPTVKIYQSLPMTRDDLDDVLAVIFTGVAPPTSDDLKRTPVLVRRNRVKRALEWLKLNHRNYADLVIDNGALNSYNLEGVPVEVLHRKVEEDEGNVPAAAQSQFDDETEIGTEDGPCPFTVHGLTGERYSQMTTQQRKAAALQHLKNGGEFLAVGHATDPQSLYNNPDLYPSMFPWLFPFGYGGVGQQVHSGLLSREKHLVWLLMYHDKRFQRDAGFVIVAFNHQLIRQGTTGSFMLVKRNNFNQVADSIKKVSPSVLAAIAEKLKLTTRYIPQTQEEKQCFSLLDQIEYVGSHVSGSLANKKFQRNELWSLVSFKNAPLWFITLSPADTKHPLCIYMAAEGITFKPELRSYAERQHLVTGNPVACARFFDHVVQLFIKHICGWHDNERKEGVFGVPSAYFGTVEQQGRMTLHLHFLLWVEGSIPPQKLRERLMSGDSEFEKEIIAYLDSCRVGEFFNGTMQEVSEDIPVSKEPVKDRGIHTIMVDTSDTCPPDYIDPTLTLPEAPPNICCEEYAECNCPQRDELDLWYDRFTKIVDDIVFRSNVHKCFGRRDAAAVVESDGKTVQVPKVHATGKGCTNKDGVCTARFPRDTYLRTVVERHTGRIDLKKKEKWINDITPVISATFRCNTDTTCLLSGTAVKAILGYVTDYITKGWLKTHQVFSTMYDSFSRTPTEDDSADGSRPGNSARRMIMRVVNSLSAKMEIGAPMAAMYLLGNPDKYCSHEFRVFYWKNYVNFVQDEWLSYLAQADPEDVADCNDAPDPSEKTDIGLTRSQNENEEVAKMMEDQTDETVQVARSKNSYVGKTTTDDYRWRPTQHSALCLYEWIQCSVKQYEQSSRMARGDLQFYAYQREHPLYKSHLVACDLDRRSYVVPNFVGPSLPRKDSTDMEEYCRTMLVLFCPWRTGIDLKTASETWEERFERYQFTDRQIQLMENFNVRYECYDARDDFAANSRSENKNDDSDDDDDPDVSDVVDPERLEDCLQDPDDYLTTSTGPRTEIMHQINAQTRLALAAAGWGIRSNMLKVNDFALPRIALDRNFDARVWRSIVRVEKNKLFQQKFGGTSVSYNTSPGSGKVRNDAYVVPGSYLTNDFIPPNQDWANIITDTANEFGLNAEQRKAFNIVANHATVVGPKQLLMYLGGMGGTGKSRVIKALQSYFGARGETYRFVILGPTGTASALIGGSTYHSFLGIRTNTTGGAPKSTLDDVLERLVRCGYIFLDEHSMLSCVDLCRISARVCDVLGMYEKPFGGLNVILAGDFAQLPPAQGHSLYSRRVAMRQTPRQKPIQQENTIGKMIWLQFTTVVILKENMRQLGNDPVEAAFRTALCNLRYWNCTPEDITLIKTRIVNRTPDLTLDTAPWKNVSIITSYNRVKDQINESNVERFAIESDQQIAEFYSVDNLSTKEVKRKDKEKVYLPVTSMTNSLRETLWAQPPHTSEQVPACLKICRGLPVIIRYNDATELCITRGQEARVVGWTQRNFSKSDKRQVLDVLYLELISPPHPVKLPNLPLNVVPLTPMSQSIEARLPSDKYVCISRNQVPVLPNFAMTDYAAQGKTREVNVIDLTDSRNFQSAYTCLSRGTSLAGTLVLRDFSNDLLKGEMDGELRQEFRELDTLDAITDLQYHKALPLNFDEGTRWGTIEKFKIWRSKGWVESVISIDDTLEPQKPETGQYEIHTIAALAKRKHVSGPTEPRKKTRIQRPALIGNAPWLAPMGPKWDSRDHSCAYDSLTFILYWLWFSNKERWGHWSTHRSPISREVFAAFQSVDRNYLGRDLTTARDRWREKVREQYPGEYPAGPVGVNILELHRRLLGVADAEWDVEMHCETCGQVKQQRRGAGEGITSYVRCMNFASIQDHVDNATACLRLCDICHGKMFAVNELSEMLTFEIVEVPQIVVNKHIKIRSGETYRLVGVVYYGHSHFISRIVSADKKVFVHDGIYGSHSTAEGELDTDIYEEDLTSCNDKAHTLAFYALD